MLPILEVGPWHVRTSSIIYALAVLVAGAFYLRRLVGRRFRAGPAGRVLLWIVLAGGLGANLGGILSLGYELLTGVVFPVPVKSVSMPGALLGGAVAAWLICRHYRLSFWWACDQAIPALPLGQAIGQFGCLARGCCYGRPADTWLALYLPDSYGDWAPRYPTQLLSAAALLLILALLLTVERMLRPDPPVLLRQAQDRLFPAGKGGGSLLLTGAGRGVRFPGAMTLLYLTLYLLLRFSIEFIRGDALPAWIGPLNTIQVACAVGLLLVVMAAGRQLKGVNA